MSVELIHKHQRKAYDLMKQGLQSSGRAAYVFPMGGGKSFLPLKYMQEYPDKKVLFVSPNIGIINQFKKYISEYLLDGKRVTKTTFPNFRAVTYQKVALAQETTDLKPDVIIFDEIHRMGAENWEPAIDKLIAANPNAQIIGMSATPERTDKRNMAYEKFGQDVVYEMSLTEALSGSKENEVVLNGARYARVLSAFRGELEQYKSQIDLISDEKQKNRLLQYYKELSSIVSNSPDISDIMASAMKKKNGKYIVFCSNRDEMFEKMKQVQSIFGKVNSNINVDYVISRKDGKGKSPKDNRLTLEDFTTREAGDSLNLLFCVDMLNEGVHIEGIDGEIQFKPTDSKIRYKQMIGRVLSSDKSADETVIIDAVNNWIRQIDTFSELAGAVKRGSMVHGKKKKDTQDLFKLTDEEIQFVDLLREINEVVQYHSNNTFEEIIRWLESHDGRLPRGNISKNKRHLKTEELSEEEKYERILYQRWSRSYEKKILDDYAGVPLSEFPKELEDYVDKIDLLRSYGFGLRKQTAYEELIEWLETHDGKMPISQVTRNNKRVKVDDITEEQNYQINLYSRWSDSPEYKALRACIGIDLNDIPKEYMQYRNQIATLRSYGLGVKRQTAYEEFIQWVETHNGEIPHGYVEKDGRKLTSDELTDEQRKEKSIYVRWSKSKEREALTACAGIPLDKLPEEYKMYEEQIRTLRSYGFGITTYESLINWMSTHNGRMPRGMIVKNKRRLKTSELSKEEQYERNLYYRAGRLPEYIAYRKTRGIPIDEIPEEYSQYKEQIIAFREFEKIRTSKGSLRKMKESVGKQVASNQRTRGELSELAREAQENASEQAKE